jgi:hypothetical protein
VAWCAGRGRPNLRERETGPALEVLGERPPSVTVAAAVSRRKMLRPAVNGMEPRLPAPGGGQQSGCGTGFLLSSAVTPKAEACRRLADLADDEQRKALWIERADHWEQLAVKAAKRPTAKTAASLVLPEPVEPIRRQRCITRGGLDFAVPQVRLRRPVSTPFFVSLQPQADAPKTNSGHFLARASLTHFWTILCRCHHDVS